MATKTPDAAAADATATALARHQVLLAELGRLAALLSARLGRHLDGAEPNGPCLGDDETPVQALDTLARAAARLIPLERQALGLGTAEEAHGAAQLSDGERARRIARLLDGVRARRTGRPADRP